MNPNSVSCICLTIIVLAMATCSVVPREHASVSCVRAGGEWSWFSCRRPAP